MSEAALEPLAPSDEHPRRRLARTVAWLVGILALLVALRIAGVDVWGWLEQLWETVAPTSAQATPMTYMADGRQYVVFAAGGHSWYYPMGVDDYVLAYALPETPAPAGAR